MSKSKDVDAYLQGELCAKAELATKLLHDIAWSKWTTDAIEQWLAAFQFR